MGYIGVILRLYRDSGKENGSYNLGFRGLGFGMLFFNLVPFWVWYVFLVRTLIRTTKNSTTLEGLGWGCGGLQVKGG